MVQGRRFPQLLQGAVARAAPSNWGTKEVSRLGVGVAANVLRPFPKILLISRSRERRNETRRPLISLGCARLKPNRVGQQRLHSTIFPFGPPKNKAKKSFS